MVRMRRAAAALGLLLLPIVILACSFGSGPTADPAKVIRDAGPALGLVKTASVELKFGAGATFFGFTVVSASGKVKLPSDSQVTIKAKQSSDSLIEIAVTTVGTQTWVTVPFLGVQEVTGAQATASGAVVAASETEPAAVTGGFETSASAGPPTRLRCLVGSAVSSPPSASRSPPSTRSTASASTRT